MSDMPRPRTVPPAPDHERHDALLVAQFVAGDPLAPEQRAVAQRLVSGCGACAALAADLPAISRTVAQEPVPPRRRDFRLAPQQAEELRGNALTRVLRRLSLPSSRAFQPAAAGVLSIGLMFVVAGYAWPDGGTVTVQAEPILADRATMAPSGLLEAPPAAAEAVRPDTDDGAALQGADRAVDDPEFADSLAQSQAGLAEGSMQKSLAADEGARTEADAEPRAAAALDAAERSDASAPEAAELEAQERSPAQSSPVTEETGLGAAADAVDATAGDTAGTVDETAGNTAYREVTPADEIADPAQESAADISTRSTADDVVERAPVAVEAPTVPDRAVPDAEIVANADDGGAEDLLIVLGLALALGGGGLLLLGWLARRARDPLAP